MATTEYKVGTISQILAGEGGGGSSDGGGGSKSKLDSKLAALFSGNNAWSPLTKVYRTVKVTESQIFQKKKSLDNGNGSDEVNGGGDGADLMKEGKKKKKKGKSGDGSDNSQEPAEPVPIPFATDDEAAKKTEKKLKKKLKRLNNNGEDVGLSPLANGNDKVQENGKDKKKKNKKGKISLVDVEAQQAEHDQKDDSSLPENNRIPIDKKIKIKKPKKLQITADVQIKKAEDTDSEGETKPRINSNEPKTLAERNAPKPKDKKLEERTIFVGNLPTDTKKKELRKMFKKFGGVETVRLRCGAPSKPSVLKKVAINKKELHPDNNTVAAYIRFSTVDEAEKAAAASCGMVFHEHHLTVDLADQAKNKKDNKKAIFVGNLSLKLTDEELWRFFEDCGKISSVRIVRDNATGLGKGFGYVNFDEKESVDTALFKKNQCELKNRAVRISRCVKKLKVKKNGQVNNNSNNKGVAAVGKRGANPPSTKQQQRGVVKKEDEKVSSITNKKKKFEGKKFEGKKWRNDEGGEKKKIRKNRVQANEFSGDRTAEIMKLKRKSKKPNRGEMKKAKIVKLLTQTNQPNRKKTFK